MCSCCGDRSASDALGWWRYFSIFVLLVFWCVGWFYFFKFCLAMLARDCRFCGSPPWSLHGLIFPFAPLPFLSISLCHFLFTLPFPLSYFHTSLFICDIVQPHYTLSLVLFLSVPVLHSLAYGSHPCVLSCSGGSSRSGPSPHSDLHRSGVASPGTAASDASRGPHHEPHPAHSDGCHAAQWHPHPGASHTGWRAYLHHPLRVPLCLGTHLPAGVPHRA